MSANTLIVKGQMQEGKESRGNLSNAEKWPSEHSAPKKNNGQQPH
ncbi:hypothetical protein VCRA2121O157_250079 [Vibrio crassostreae]|nr:hypothetical protein VCRA2113O137_210108 [Vibrio crassostreae]CAK1933284.1 hypothetical protein VCRA2113O138_250013 [Vibrio crassostreae]CAK1946011.1 hypothetical protein VCRA2113O140_250079 [Vibrio crassostreae]CAK2280635.1 hypothetical protein VCRA2116O141_180014 [Vibrio crassostreae]CAK2526418.1 hypothetical protein VCRA2113O415_630004 [Vibrio crassostreae]